ncbi:MAG: DUF3566 domain-containing protein [Acidimicrobiia bacterium]|nr:DUF3566 domain-containing protein [Acidimicrobiia bacterium]
MTTAVPTTRRRVRRIVRKVDPWTILKVGTVFFLISGLAMVLLSIIAWTVITNLGLPEAIDSAARDVSFIEANESLFRSGEQYFRVVLFFAFAWSVLMTGMATLGAVAYNLIADIVGGLEFSVMEDIPISEMPELP